MNVYEWTMTIGNKNDEIGYSEHNTKQWKFSAEKTNVKINAQHNIMHMTSKATKRK